VKQEDKEPIFTETILTAAFLIVPCRVLPGATQQPSIRVGQPWDTLAIPSLQHATLENFTLFFMISKNSLCSAEPSGPALNTRQDYGQCLMTGCSVSKHDTIAVPHIAKPRQGRAVAQVVSPGVPQLWPGSGHAGFVVDKAALWQAFSEYFCFPCQPFHRLFRTYHSPRPTVALVIVDLVPLHPKFHFK
jgi:hypothetical protein